MKKLIILCLILSGCGLKIREDRELAYIEGDFLSLETEICGVRASGINGCYFTDGESTDGKTLKIQGVYRGRVNLFSTNCPIDRSLAYGMNQEIELNLNEIFGSNFRRENSCTLNVEIFPDQPSQLLPIYGQRGRVVIEIIPQDSIWVHLNRGFGQQIRSSFFHISPVTTVNLPGGSNGTWRMVGCEKDMEGKYENGEVQFDEASLLAVKESCKYQFLALDDNGKRYRFVHYVHLFSDKVNFLEEPEITFEGDQVCARGSPSLLSFISINDRFVNGSHLCAEALDVNTVRTYSISRNTFRMVRKP